MFNSLKRFLYQHRGVFCGIGRFLCQVSYLIRDDRKALSGNPGSCRLYRRIQGKNIGLEGNIIDSLDDFTDFTGLLIDILHCSFHFLHLFIRIAHFFTGVLCLRICQAGILCGFLNLLGDIIHRSGKLFDRRSLFRSALRQPLCTGTDLRGTGVYLYRTLLDFRHGFGKVGTDVLNGIKERTIGAAVVIRMIHFHVKITLGKLIQFFGKVCNDRTDTMHHISHGVH